MPEKPPVDGKREWIPPLALLAHTAGACLIKLPLSKSMDLSPFYSPPHTLGGSEEEGGGWSLARDNASLAPDGLCHPSVPTEEPHVPRMLPSPVALLQGVPGLRQRLEQG